VPFNASEGLIHGLQSFRFRKVPPPRLFTAVLPTDWRQAQRQLHSLVKAVKPDIALHFGVSRRARGFVIETRACNQTSARQDCSGASAMRRCVRRNAAAALPTTLPAARLVQRLRMEGIPAKLSSDAGRYLCNTLLYESLHLAEAAGGACTAGFVHIPALGAPEYEGALASNFGWLQLMRGAGIILDMLAHAAKADQGCALPSGRPCNS